MKYLKIFENFSNKDWEKEMLDLIEDMVYNIKDVATEYLDECETLTEAAQLSLQTIR